MEPPVSQWNDEPGWRWSLRLLYVLALAAVFPALDLATSWLYGQGVSSAGLLRNVRDGSIAVVALLCLTTVRLPRNLQWAIWLYFGFIAVYLPVGLANGVMPAVALPSAGTLVLPVFLFLVGYYSLRSAQELHVVLQLWIVLGVMSTVLGMWEIGHTEFWIDSVRLPEYMVNVKGVQLGLEPLTHLPWNFFHDETATERRAAGLLAAPLAQGAFLAAVAVMALALYARRQRLLGLLLAGILTFGVWQSGTRGALIIEGIGVLGLLAADSGLLRVRREVRWFAVSVLGGAALLVAFLGIQESFSVRDGSTVGHWDALMTNLRQFPDVLLLGDGVGVQGGIAAQSQTAVVGGGEGAFFSLAFQLGLPGALVFLWFYFSSIGLLLAAESGRRGLPWALAVLLTGFATTLITSEHVLTLSGMAAPWLLAGGALRVSRRTRRPV